jgi:hypothetical protein
MLHHHAGALSKRRATSNVARSRATLSGQRPDLGRASEIRPEPGRGWDHTQRWPRSPERGGRWHAGCEIALPRGVPKLAFAIVLVWDAADTGGGEVTTWIGRISGSPGRFAGGGGVSFRPMNFKRRVLSAPGKEVLLEIGRGLELEVTTRMGVDELRDALAKSKRAKLDAIVQESLSRDTLKDICGAVGLDDTGKEKAALVERILAAGGDKAANGVGDRIDPAAVRSSKAAEGGGAPAHFDPKDSRWFSTDCIEPPPVGS